MLGEQQRGLEVPLRGYAMAKQAPTGTLGAARAGSPGCGARVGTDCP